MTPPRVIVALDYPDADSALRFVRRVTPSMCRVKVGNQLFTAAGPALVARLVDAGFAVFLDLKFHDIPNTVEQACLAAGKLGVWMLNVHALGGAAMLKSARDAIAGQPTPPILIAVTVLTSLTADDLGATGIGGSTASAALKLARLSRQCGLDGVVCSPQEAALVRRECGADFCLVTPGIRPIQAAPDDQSRVMTPAGAISAGAHYLVIGRPVTQAADPKAALETINAELGVAGTSMAAPRDVPR